MFWFVVLITITEEGDWGDGGGVPFISLLKVIFLICKYDKPSSLLKHSKPVGVMTDTSTDFLLSSYCEAKAPCYLAQISECTSQDCSRLRLTAVASEAGQAGSSQPQACTPGYSCGTHTGGRQPAPRCPTAPNSLLFPVKMAVFPWTRYPTGDWQGLANTSSVF